MKKSLIILIAICFILSACGANGSNNATNTSSTRTFTDDLGRSVTIPNKITKIAVTGPLSQIYVLPIGSDLMVGYASAFSKNAEKYIQSEFLALPELGQLYGGKGTMNLESLLAAAPDVVIDVGEPKGSIADDFDALTEQTGIPFVHITANFEKSSAAYLRLGELLGREEKAHKIADYLDKTMDEILGVMEKVDANNGRKTMIYCLGDKGTNILANGSFHAETFNYVASNIAVVDEVTGSGDGNEVDMEQIIMWNPDAVIFAPISVYSQVKDDVVWNQLDAIANGEYYECPSEPYGWLQSPPSVQRFLGAMWLESILYPDYCSFDLYEKVAEYYDIFYGYDLSTTDYQALTQNSIK